MRKAGSERGLLSTWWRAAFAPSALFAGDEPAATRLAPLPFALVMGAIAYPLSALATGGGGRAIAGAFLALIVSPFATVLSVYLSAALTHVALLIVRGKHGTFGDTRAAVCYAQAPSIFGAVPLVGPIVGSIWSLVVLGIGLRHAHRTTPLRAGIAVTLGLAMPVLLALGLRAGVVEAFKIPSGSMMPTLTMGDHIFVEKLGYGPLIPGTDARIYSGLPPKRGDVIVFKFPENKEQDFVKRAIALPGDTLEVINGRPILDGWLVPHCHVGTFHRAAPEVGRFEKASFELFVEFLADRDYLTFFDADPDAERCTGEGACGDGLTCRAGVCGTLQGPWHVRSGEVWVMGDNRNNSHDSRSWHGGLGAGVPFENIKGRATIVWMSFLPGGGVASDRLLLSIHGRPTLPAGNEALAPALEKCLRERPPPAQTTPPGR